MKKILRKIRVILYCALTVFMSAFAGCSSMMPTREPPLTEELGYKVLEWRGWTLVGLNQAAYKFEVEKLKTWKVMIGFVNLPAIELHNQIVNWLGALGVGGVMGGLPLALNRLPKGAVRKEDHEREVAVALKQQPPA